MSLKCQNLHELNFKEKYHFGDQDTNIKTVLKFIWEG